MDSIVSFGPVSNHSARALVLGSMPGVRSLAANQYYAHPRNAFWRIMAEIFDFDVASPYEIRLEALKTSGIALWDVLHACIRSGSLDSAIRKGSRVPNDFQSFFGQHPGIQLVCFNGAEAEKSYSKHVLPRLNINGLKYVRLPSTSPAHAALSFEKKAALWREALGDLADRK
jgi:TDG/mug DNA glycosylase family protein